MDIGTFLHGRGVAFVTMLHAPAPSAARFAQSLHVPGDRVAKSVLVRVGDSYVLAVLPATYRVDLMRLAGFLGVSEAAIEIATEDEVEQMFCDCERGAIPPFGRLYGMPTIVDKHLAVQGEIIVEGNMRHEGIRLRYRDYEAVEQPLWARFAVPIQPRRRGMRRRAG